MLSASRAVTFRRFLMRPTRTGPARRVIEQERPVPAVRVAEMPGVVRAEDLGARSQLVQPPVTVRAVPHGAVAATAISALDEDEQRTLQRLIVRVSVKRDGQAER